MWLQYIPFSNNIKKRIVRYLIQRFVGQFFEEKLRLDQMTIDLYNGTGSVSDVTLDVQVLNDLAELHNLPFEFVDGYISEMSVSIPWGSLLTDSSYVEVSGVVITVQPKQREESDVSTLESMWSSMSSSMQLAAECMKQSPPEPADRAPDSQGQQGQMEGLELFAQTIESILSRIKVKFINTLLRIEHLPKRSRTGVAVEISIKHMDYCDEARMSAETQGEPMSNPFSVNKFHFEGVSLYSDEFPSEARTFSRSLVIDNKSGDSDSNSGVNCDTKPIIIAKLGGRQEMRLTVKKGENIQGPKVDLEMNLGSLSVFLSPRQLHLLMELGHGFGAPDTQDDSNVSRCAQKPMEADDYDRVEQQLMTQLQPTSSRGLHSLQGWSSAPLEDSDEEFLPMRGDPKNLSDSTFSAATSLNASFSSSCSSYSKSITSMTSSNPANSGQQGKKKQKEHKGSATDTEAGQEESHLHVRLSSVAIVLLHEDILTLSPETQRVTLSSLSQMSKLADMFFAKLGLFAAFGYGKKDFEAAKLVFLEACQLNHIRLLAAPVIAESDMKRSAGASVMGSVLTVACVELLECLVEKAAASAQPTVEYIELVKFEQPSSAQDSPYQVSARPDVRVQVKRTKQTGRPSLSQRAPPTQTNVNVLLHNCCLEVDLSIVDRISAVLSCQPLCARSNDLPATGHFDLTGICLPDHSYQTHSRTDIKISSPLVIFKLRFPIPDLRPLYDMDRPPWWKRNVRKDILLAHLEQASFTTAVDTKIAYSSYEMLSSQLTLLFQEGDTDIQVPIGVAQSDDKASQAGGLLRLSVQINPKACLEGMEDDESAAAELPLSASMTQSVYVDSKRKEPSPFSSKKVVHESDTTHTNTDTSSQFEGEELVVPGNREEMKLFIDTASRNTKTQVEINLPKANLHFPSKHLYEVFYNRLSSDLSLWVPSPQVVSGPIGSPAVSAFSPPAFTMCKSAVQCESESDSDTSENVYYSVWDSKPAVARAESDPGGQSKLTVTLTVGQGTLSVVTDLKGSGVEPTGHGHLGLRFQEANLFTVSGYKGTPLHNYICAQVNNFSLLHNGEVTEPLFNLHSFGGGGATGGLLDEVIYKTESGARVRPGGGVAVGVGSDRSADMLTIAMTSRVDESRVKMVRLACGVRGATLRHRVTPSSHSWLMQLIGFFDVMDYPVAGYQPSQAITELHQHLWDCAVDYRPVHLPLRSLLAVASLSVSSNMAARTSCSTLRFIAEDAFIFISDKLLPSVELRLDYVCVVDLGLFELSVRTSDSSPRVDLRASNNVLRIRTCSDSARLLTQLIGYLAAYGDLAETTNLPDGPPPDAADPDPTETLSRSTVQRVNSLMEEAMVDHFKDTKSKAGSGQRAPGVEVFFFPGEVVPDGVEAADVSPPPLDSSDADSVEFVMVEHEAGSGYMSGASQGMPEIRLLTIAPVTIIENHFSKPLGKTDFLKAPLNFPAPVYKYTLREMSVIWYMYGGLDFKPVVQAKKHVTICSESGSTPSSPLLKKHATVDVNYSKTCPQQVQFSDRPFSGGKPKTESSRQKSMWWTRGGLGRDHDLLMELQLNKVRFQHEVYPETTREASRQVLLIHEVDIRDRLAVSKINKFLYQYTSECRPKQSHANMVVVKATNLRPDPQLAVQECCLRVSLLPLRLNIDQDSLLFLITFANEIAGFIDKEDDSEALVPVSPRHVPPVMTVDSEPPPAATEDDSTLALDDHPKHQTSSEDVTTATPIFFRRFEFTPEVPIRLDYEGKHVDMKHGPLAGLLMGLAQLNCSELRLKRLSHRHGLLGFEKLLSFVMSEWLGDIKKNQLPSLLGGVGPMYSVVQLFQGIRDLFWLPIEQYQKDGRIVRGLQRGANSFTTCTAMAALELTTRIVHAIQCVAETAFDMVSPGPSVRRRKHRRGKQPRSRHTPPADFREGVSNAMALVKEGIGETAHTLVQEAMAEHEDKGAIGAVGVVLRQIPPACVTPLILASAATSNLLGGVRSQLVPDVRREAALKWRDDQPPQPPHHRH